MALHTPSRFLHSKIRTQEVARNLNKHLYTHTTVGRRCLWVCWHRNPGYVPARKCISRKFALKHHARITAISGLVRSLLRKSGIPFCHSSSSMSSMPLVAACRTGMHSVRRGSSVWEIIIILTPGSASGDPISRCKACVVGRNVYMCFLFSVVGGTEKMHSTIIFSRECTRSPR